ncbi:MAG: DRTGG domain-containing protein, partial [Candidatus Omnitrophica bacterium]|nr:DRTGG domain-containing protein [Candidatus Omnitrophota bacterium]
PIDEILLNKALLEKEGVKLLGVIINKVLPGKFDRISRLVRKGLERRGINVLGVIPYNKVLSYPSIRQILEEAEFELLCGKDALESYVSTIIVGAMAPHDAIKYIVDDSLLITPGDREDIITAVLKCFRENDRKRLKVSGIVLSAGIIPQEEIMQALADSGIPVLLAKEDTYTVTSSVHDLTVKIRPRDEVKIKTAVEMIKTYVNLDAIVKGM